MLYMSSSPMPVRPQGSMTAAYANWVFVPGTDPEPQQSSGNGTDSALNSREKPKTPYIEFFVKIKRAEDEDSRRKIN